MKTLNQIIVLIIKWLFKLIYRPDKEYEEIIAKHLFKNK